jgi:hypothetical protein
MRVVKMNLFLGIRGLNVLNYEVMLLPGINFHQPVSRTAILLRLFRPRLWHLEHAGDIRNANQICSEA